MTKKINISSTALEKSIDLARGFLEKLISPSIGEVGLLLRDSVTFWKFKNQVRILNATRSYCEKNKISPKSIPLKLLCPWLDGAGLEEDGILQDKWAILLSNMVDSEQNIENHVFPYILGQISTNEFVFLERVFHDKRERMRLLSVELNKFRSERASIESRLFTTISDLSAQVEEKQKVEPSPWTPEVWELQKKKQEAERELRGLEFKEFSISYRLSAPEVLPEGGLRDFEMSNVIRLGLVKSVHETYANSKTLEIPNDPDQQYLKVDLEIDMESEDSHILTELGELFIGVCTEKRVV